MKNITECVGEEYKIWSKGDCIVFNAHTGAGKTYFVLNTLLPYAASQGRKILFLCNRVILKRQIEADIANNIDPQLADFIRVETYQKVEAIYSYSQVFEGAFYCVFDEAQYYLGDADFNPNVNKMVKLMKESDINNRLCNIFMSATLDYVYPFINDIYCGRLPLINIRPEDFIVKHELPKSAKVYTLESDYSYITPYYFNNHDYKKILEKIQNSEKNEKWVIFVKDKREGAALEKAITVCLSDLFEKSELANQVVFLIAETKNSKLYDNQIYNQIVESKTFDAKVLIATKFLDNGIDFKDENLKNVVISSVDKTEFIQMVGRYRRVKADDTLNLYIACHSTREITGHLCNISEKNRIIEEFKKERESAVKYDTRDDGIVEYDEYHNRPDKEEKMAENMYKKIIKNKNLFIRKEKVTKTCEDKHKLNAIFEVFDVNAAVYIVLKYNKRYFKELLSKGHGDKYFFLKEQLGWLGKEYDKTAWIDYDDCMKELNEYLEAKVDVPMSKEEQMLFREQLTVCLEKAFDTINKKSRTSGLKKLNDVLEINDLPYRIESDVVKRKTIWTLKKILTD